MAEREAGSKSLVKYDEAISCGMCEPRRPVQEGVTLPRFPGSGDMSFLPLSDSDSLPSIEEILAVVIPPIYTERDGKRFVQVCARVIRMILF